MIFTLATRNLIHDRMRFFVTLVGIVFSIVLVAVQTGMYLGSEKTILAMIDKTDTDLWVVAEGAQSFDRASMLKGRERYSTLPIEGIASVDDIIVGCSKWKRTDGGDNLIVLVGVDPQGGALEPWNVVEGDVSELALPEAVAVDKSYFKNLGVTGIGSTGTINNREARVRALTQGIRSFTTLPFVFMSKRQARTYLNLPADVSTFLTVKLKDGADLETVKSKLSARFSEADVLTPDEFRARSRSKWLFNTGAGAALIGGAILGIIVGVVIVAQTLYSSAKDHITEFATLRALGSSSGYIIKVILWQALLSAVIGYTIAMAIDLIIWKSTQGSSLTMIMTPELAFWLFVLTVTMCVFSAIAAIIKVIRIDPATVFSS